MLPSTLSGHPDNLQDLIAGLNLPVTLVNGKQVPLINFDNAATTPPFRSVLEAIESFAPWYGAVHRGGGTKSEVTTRLYEEARGLVADFVGSDRDRSVVIFVKNTTEAINKLAYRLAQNAGHRNIVISTVMEHHSNDLPWRNKFRVLYAEVDEAGRLRLDDLERKLKASRGRARLVTVTGASNVTGHVNPIGEIARMAHHYGAEIMVDGAQMVPHLPVSMKGLADGEFIDYLAFSAHKMYAPFGTGVLIGPRKAFEHGHSELVGGGTVELVSRRRVRWAEVPHRDEAGTPNMMGVIALSAAIKSLNRLGMQRVMEVEAKLADYARRGLSRVPGLIFYGDNQNHKHKVGIIPFNILGVPHEAVASYLANEHGIAVRSGCFCAQPYVQRLLGVSPVEVKEAFATPGKPHRGMVRVSFGLYNTKAEVDVLVNALHAFPGR
ncbi:MAG: aminotransferase class V-fold PLP-dependent enzyme [Bacillota bacterium]